MLHCGWRGLAAGIVARGAQEVGARRGRDRARDRPLLLRGRRGGPRCVRAASATGSPTGRHARPARGRAAAARRGRRRARSSPPTSARAASPSSSSPTGATRGAPAARAGWPGSMRCLSRSATSTRRRCAATSSACASAAGRRSRSSRRPSTWTPRSSAALAEAGVELVGENRLQDLEAKRELYGDRFAWDFIGNLQSRKVKRILPLVRLIHSVATDSVLEQLGRHGGAGDRGPGRGQRRRRGGQGRRRPGRAGRVHRAAARCGSAG